MGWLRDMFGRTTGGAASDAADSAPAPPPAWRRLGNEALASGDFAEAARCYGEGVVADPQDAALRLNLGFVLLQQGQAEAAAERLRQALALRRPGDGCEAHDAHFLLGQAQVSLGKQVQALGSFEAALRARPDFPEAREEGARLLHVLQRHEEAVEWLRELLRLQPTHFHRVLLATELRASGRHAEAVDVIEPVCAQEPANLDASVLRYGALMKLGRYGEALDEAGRQLAIHGRQARFLVNRSVPLERMGRYEEALAGVEEALALDPGNRDAVVNRCTLLMNLRRPAEAVAAAERALARAQGDADLHWSLAVGLLTLGDLRRGFAEAEWRGQAGHFRGKLLEVDLPRWRGESLQGRRIFLYGEQGLGDNVQFLRFIPAIAAVADAVDLLVPQALEALVSRTLPANCRVLPQHSPVPVADFQCPLMSLPAMLGTSEESLPAEIPYLRADPAAIRTWRERLGSGALNVGIAWSGNPRHTNDHNRSMPLEAFRSVDTDGCRFFTVQPDVPEADRLLLSQWGRAADLGRTLGDFDETAAMFEALDLLITVDTSVAHVAGALGRPVWILLPYAPDWRWMLERSDSPWYPSARLYRQASQGDWRPVLARVKEDLAALAGAR